MGTWEIIGLVLLFFDILVIVSLVLIYFTLKQYIRNNLIILSVDELRSEENQTFVFTLYNVYKHKTIWNTNVQNLKLYLMRSKELVGCVFEKHPTIKGALRVTLPKDDSFHDTIVKYKSLCDGKISVSHDDGHTLTKVIRLGEREIDKIKEQKSGVDEGLILKQSMFLDYKNSDKQFRFDYADLIDFNKGSHIHINEGQSTATSLRVQMYIPDEYLAKINLVPEEVGFYYCFEGHLYSMKVVYLHKIGNVFEWDLVDLKPNTAYVGISLNSRHNPLIRPSKAFYGITRDEDGVISNLDGAQIAPPTKNQKQFKLWNEQIAIEAIGEKLTKLQYNIIVKKHFEYNIDDAFMHIDQAEQLYDDFKWLKVGKELDKE